jgi:hypothetical protein
MIDFEDMLGLRFEEEPEIVDNYEAQPDCETSGGWGSFLLGGAVGALWSSAVKNKSNDCMYQTDSFDSFTEEERLFLRQIWRWEEEFDKARADDDVERIVLLLNALVGCINSSWKALLPGNDEYFATDKFDAEFESLALPILNKATEISEGELRNRLTPDQFERINGRQMSLNPDDWSFTMK